MKFEMVTDPGILDTIISQIGATEKQLKLARPPALRKTGAWLKTQVKKAAAKQLDITQKSLENRFLLRKISEKADEMTLMIGTNPVLPFSIGNPSIMGSASKPLGVKVRSHQYPGAFIRRIYSDQKKVWIRLDSTHYSPQLYPTTYGPSSEGGGRFPGSKGRFPVVRAAIQIEETVQQIVESLEDEVFQQYAENLAQELKSRM